MEKFGIFNLLSALSSLAAKPAEEEAEKREEAPAPPKTESAQPAGVFTAEERKTRAAEMLERHEKISRRIRRR